MNVQETLRVALGDSPMVIPTFTAGGVASPSPRWKRNFSESEIAIARMKCEAEYNFELDRSVWMAPTHGTDVCVASDSHFGAGAYDPETRFVCDALISQTPGLYLAAVSADCPIIYLEDVHNSVCALVHAGWRGLELRILRHACEVMKTCGADLSRTHAYVAPFITGRNYIRSEYGESVRFFTEYAAMYKSKKGFHCDMEVILRKQLEECGINFDRTTFDGRCTYENPYLFSHVRTTEECGNGFQRGSNVTIAGLPSR